MPLQRCCCLQGLDESAWRSPYSAPELCAEHGYVGRSDREECPFFARVQLPRQDSCRGSLEQGQGA